MYDELVKRLREFASIPEHCENVESCDGCSKEEICLSFTNKRIIEVATQAADAIEELSRRETPMRVRITTSTKRCPSCNKQLSGIGNIHRNYPFCRWCGQALDWTEPPKEETE